MLLWSDKRNWRLNHSLSKLQSNALTPTDQSTPMSHHQRSWPHDNTTLWSHALWSLKLLTVPACIRAVNDFLLTLKMYSREKERERCQMEGSLSWWVSVFGYRRPCVSSLKTPVLQSHVYVQTKLNSLSRRVRTWTWADTWTCPYHFLSFVQ